MALSRNQILAVCGAVALVWFMNSGTRSSREVGSEVVVESGLTFSKSKERELSIVPFMVQKRMLGLPSEAGVSASIYFVSESDFKKASEQYQKRGGCWPSTLQRYKQELLVVGDADEILQRAKSELPFPGQRPDMLRVKGTPLKLQFDHPKSEHARMVSQNRNGVFFWIKSVKHF